MVYEAFVGGAAVGVGKTSQKAAELGLVADRGFSLKRRQQHEQRH